MFLPSYTQRRQNGSIGLATSCGPLCSTLARSKAAINLKRKA